tara:strand:+ start:192 stop:449 length:258 start_codon:yes stop_codon:yes gene_type:complete
MRFARLCDRAVGFIALFRKKSHQKTIRFRKFFTDFLVKPCWGESLSHVACGKNDRFSRGTRIATNPARMNSNRHLFPMEGSYGIV